MRKVVESLPPTKVGQELEIARRFGEALKRVQPHPWKVEALAENDHDFLLVGPDASIEVEAVEIAAKRDFLIKIPNEEWLAKTHGFQSVAVFGVEEIWGVDRQKQHSVVWDKISLKLAKNYSKGKRPLWLLLWTTYQGLKVTWPPNDVSQVSRMVLYARKKLRSLPSVVFDEVWIWTPSVIFKIWPSEEDIREREADMPVNIPTNAPIEMFIPATQFEIGPPRRRQD